MKTNSLELLIKEKAIFIPAGFFSKHSLVYDKKFRLIEESCLRRGIEKKPISDVPLKLPNRIISLLSEYNGSLLFLGSYRETHYGHLLTEGLSRLWYLLENQLEDNKIIDSTNPFGYLDRIKYLLKREENHCIQILNQLGVSNHHFNITKRPVRASQIIIPEQSWFEQSEINSQHLKLTKFLGEKMFPKSKIDSTDRPVFLSRSKLRHGNFIYLHQEEIEKKLKSKGVKIIYPERLSLADQIMVFNKYHTFIGCEGSAFHNILFRFVEKKPNIIYLARQGKVLNFEIIDTAMGNNSTYIRCYYRKPKTNILDCNLADSVRCIEELI